MTAYTFVPIGHIRSCFTEKFGIPRQPGLVPSAEARLEIHPPFADPDAFRGLEGFSHIWILFVFHRSLGQGWKPMVRPPRLGGNQRVGVFASRSPFRPNPIGQSVVKLVSIEKAPKRVTLRVKGVDLMDGTPVLDLKPYVPFADCRPQAGSGYAPDPPQAHRPVLFSAQADQACRQFEDESRPDLKKLICEVLALDPRPGYVDADDGELYGMRLWDLNIRFRFVDDRIVVESIAPWRP